jgi:hypothetical protein
VYLSESFYIFLYVSYLFNSFLFSMYKRCSDIRINKKYSYFSLSFQNYDAKKFSLKCQRTSQFSQLFIQFCVENFAYSKKMIRFQRFIVVFTIYSSFIRSTSGDYKIHLLLLQSQHHHIYNNQKKKH